MRMLPLGLAASLPYSPKVQKILISEIGVRNQLFEDLHLE